MLKRLVAYLLPLLISSPLWAFSHMLNSSGKNIIWNAASGDSLYLDVVNTSTDPEKSQLFEATQHSASEWNAVSPVKVQVRDNLYSSSQYRNTISFSTNSVLQQEGLTIAPHVVGITKVAYSVSTGRIYEADIILNDGYFNFVNDVSEANLETSTIYMPSVITHEMGHFLGLDHSDTLASTMFYESFAGQDSVHSDDVAGLAQLYAGAIYDKGEVTGTVIGGADRIGVFGAYVELVSASSGEVIAGTITDDDGSFKISALPLGEAFYVYVRPLRYPSVLPEYYLSVANDFCAGGDYQGSFVNRCGSTYEGFPQKVALTVTESSFDLGQISIRCNYAVPLEAKESKLGGTDLEYDLSDAVKEKGMAAVTGFFFSADSAERLDHYLVDLSDADLLLPQNYLLEVNVVSYQLFSNFNLKMKIYRDGDLLLERSIEDAFTGLMSDTVLSYKGSLSSASFDNVFEIELVPELATASDDDADALLNDKYFPGAAHYLDGKFKYMLSVNLKTASSSAWVNSLTNNDYFDNRYCPDAQGTRSNSAYLSNKDEEAAGGISVSDDKKSILPTCGTIGGSSSGGGTGGPLGLIVSLMVGLMMSLLILRPAPKLFSWKL